MSDAVKRNSIYLDLEVFSFIRYDDIVETLQYFFNTCS